MRLPAEEIGLQAPYESGEDDADEHQGDDGDHHARGYRAGLNLDDEAPDAALGADELTRDHPDQG